MRLDGARGRGRRRGAGQADGQAHGRHHHDQLARRQPDEEVARAPVGDVRDRTVPVGPAEQAEQHERGGLGQQELPVLGPPEVGHRAQPHPRPHRPGDGHGRETAQGDRAEPGQHDPQVAGAAEVDEHGAQPADPQRHRDQVNRQRGDRDVVVCGRGGVPDVGGGQQPERGDRERDPSGQARQPGGQDDHGDRAQHRQHDPRLRDGQAVAQQAGIGDQVRDGQRQHVRHGQRVAQGGGDRPPQRPPPGRPQAGRLLRRAGRREDDGGQQRSQGGRRAQVVAELDQRQGPLGDRAGGGQSGDHRLRPGAPEPQRRHQHHDAGRHHRTGIEPRRCPHIHRIRGEKRAGSLAGFAGNVQHCNS